MKSIVLFTLICICPIILLAHNITSTGAGGLWGTAGTWVGGLVPGSSDTAVINGPVTVDATRTVNTFIVNASKTINMNNHSVFVSNHLINNGTVGGSIGTIVFTGNNRTVIMGRGIWTGAQQLNFWGVGQVIDSTVYWKEYGNIDIVTYFAAASVINKGRINLVGATAYYLQNVPASYPCSWTNAKNSNLGLIYNGTTTSLGHSFDTLYASAPGDTVQFWGRSVAYTIKNPVGNQFCNLLLGSGAAASVVLPNNLNVNLFEVENSTSTANINGKNVTASGNWADYGTTTNNTGTVTFDAIGSQCVLRTSGTESFKNITITRSSKLGSNCTVAVSGTITVQPGGQADCTCP